MNALMLTIKASLSQKEVNYIGQTFRQVVSNNAVCIGIR